MVTAFGSIVTGAQVRAAVRSTVLAWFDTYAHELERQVPRGFVLPAFRDWQTVFTAEDLQVTQLPCLIVTSPGAADTVRHAHGGYSATWTVGVGAVVGDKDWESTYTLGESYAALLRTLVVQQRSLGGLASGVDWLGEAYDELSAAEQTTTVGVMVTFAVHVSSVADPQQGPRIVPPDPTLAEQWPLVQVVDVELTGKGG